MSFRDITFLFWNTIIQILHCLKSEFKWKALVRVHIVNGVLLWFFVVSWKLFSSCLLENDHLNDRFFFMHLKERIWMRNVDRHSRSLFQRYTFCFLFYRDQIHFTLFEQHYSSYAFRMEACKSLRWYVFYECFFSNDVRGFSSFLSPWIIWMM